MLEAKCLKKAVVPSTLIEDPSPGSLQCTRLALRVVYPSMFSPYNNLFFSFFTLFFFLLLNHSNFLLFSFVVNISILRLARTKVLVLFTLPPVPTFIGSTYAYFFIFFSTQSFKVCSFSTHFFFPQL